MSMQSIILAIIALLSFPIGLALGIFVGMLVQDLRSINTKNEQIPSSCSPYRQVSDKKRDKNSFSDDR